jgi:sRNA-binding carbon storage regulator CsrA
MTRHSFTGAYAVIGISAPRKYDAFRTAVVQIIQLKTFSPA